MLSYFNDLFLNICKPNPSLYSKCPIQATKTFNRNKLIFKIYLTISFFSLLSTLLSNYSFQTRILRLCVIFTLLAIFMLTCRSYIFLGQTINAIFFNIATFVFHIREDGAHYGPSLAHAAPLAIFCLTQNIYLTGFTSLFQLFIIMTQYRTIFIQAINFTDSSQFADKFLHTFISIYIGIQILYIIAIYALNKKTSELSMATKKAEDALEQQKIFLYSFSHEMRNPMNSLLGNLDLALMAQVAPEIREMIGTAKTCGALLLNLINTVLDAGKLGLGKLEVNPLPTRIHDTLQRVWGISYDLITKKGLKGHLKISKRVPPNILIDAHRVNQILMNLISNAIKFTETGSIMLTVSWLAGSEMSEKWFEPIPYDPENEAIFEKEDNLYAVKRLGNHQVNQDESNFILTGGIKEFNLEGVSQPINQTPGVLKIVVNLFPWQNTGCGIRSEELNKLFQKFSQVGNDTAKKQIGTGLGLFISQEICTNLGGEIRAYSKLGVGTTFIVCIPSIGLPIQHESNGFQGSNIDEKFIQKLKAKKFLTIIADDSPFNVSLVKNYYKKIGIDVLKTANNGLVAYEKYLESVKAGVPVDIMTLDIDMPVMDGKQVCEKIRQYEEKNKLRPCVIILISGNYAQESLGELLKGEKMMRKADYFLKKPLVFEEFCWTIWKASQQIGR